MLKFIVALLVLCNLQANIVHYHYHLPAGNQLNHKWGFNFLGLGKSKAEQNLENAHEAKYQTSAKCHAWLAKCKMIKCVGGNKWTSCDGVNEWHKVDVCMVGHKCLKTQNHVVKTLSRKLKKKN